MELEGKTAVITGGGSGIGEAIARAMAAEGAAVAIVDISPGAAERVRADVQESGGTALAVVADIGDADDIQRIHREILDRLGPVGIVVNNAGIVRDAQLYKMDPEQWDAVIGVNLSGTYLVSHAFVEDMVQQGGGRIVNVASRSLLGNFGQTNYAASKAGVVGFTKSLAIELGPYGITVNAIAPGYIETPIMLEVPDEVREKAIQAAPVRRAGQPEDVANTALFLASDRASYITGQCLFVCGGRSLLSALEIWS